MTETQAPTSTPPDETTSGPQRVLQVGGTRYTLLGTAHVSAESAEDVRRLIRSGEFDAVAIELCDSR
ncbi:MAG TPA: conjugal transfer protein TraB, partial [Halomonas sp.]|nr:conjugal transfer protein TraB [Halomonas sp.]